MFKYIILIAALSFCEGYKILILFPIPGKSHAILGQAYVKNLLGAGHEVTYITSFPTKNEHPGLRQIDISENMAALPKELFNATKVMRKEKSLQDLVLWTKVMSGLMNVTLNIKGVQDMLRNPREQFDAVVVEWLFSEMGSGLAALFDCPMIWHSSMVPHTHIMELISGPLNPAYTFDLVSTEYSFDFWSRLKNLWSVSKIWFFKSQLLDNDIQIYEGIYGPAAAIRGQKLKPFSEVKYNASLMLANSHVLLGDTIALPQNYKDVGGFHIESPPATLPKDLQEIMDNSKNGVIYFSFGTLVSLESMPVEYIYKFKDMLGQLKQTVIWKLAIKLPDLPKNVHLVSWAPQQSILAHPNCVLFISHSGLLSITETIYFGVPIIGIPFFADQFINIARVDSKGFGKKLDINENSPAELKEVINEVLSNPSYRQRAKEYSAIYHDRLVHPSKELVYWIEHVIKTKGARHLRSVEIKMELYKKLYLDLTVFILIMVAILYLISKIYIFNSTISQKMSRTDKKKKK